MPLSMRHLNAMQPPLQHLVRELAQLVAAVQSHGDAGLRTRRRAVRAPRSPLRPRAAGERRRVPPALPRRSERGQEGFPANTAAVAASLLDDRLKPVGIGGTDP